MKAVYATTVIGLAAIANVAHAGEANKSPGYYVGGEFGTAKSSTPVPTNIGGELQVDKSSTGWSVFAGIRPSKYFGAELNYIDFGSPHIDNLLIEQLPLPAGDIIYRATAKNTAIAGYVMGYLPLIPSRWDLFAKAGYASLTTKANSNGNYPNVCTGQPCVPLGLASASSSHQKSDFAYGLGTQYRFNSIGVRAEYQKVSTSADGPSLVSVGLTWNF